MGQSVLVYVDIVLHEYSPIYTDHGDHQMRGIRVLPESSLRSPNDRGHRGLEGYIRNDFVPSSLMQALHLTQPLFETLYKRV